MSVSTSYISVSNVITDASQELRDPECGKLGYPFYRSAAQRALQELGYDTFFDRRVWETAIPENLIVELPEGIIGLETALLFNGDNCNVSQSAVMFIKPNMYHKGGTGYLANNTWRNHDPLQYSSGWWSCPPYLGPFGNGVFFAGEFRGSLYLSHSCAQYERLHITYNGLGMEKWGDDFEIPQWAREAVTDFIILRCARALQQDNMQYYRAIINDKQTEMKAMNGTWTRAKMRWNGMDKKSRYDTIAYTTYFGTTP
jgi:hypothetical protein